MGRILATLPGSGNAATTPLTLPVAPILLDFLLWFMLRAAMTPQSRRQTSPLLLSLAAFFICGLASAPQVNAQLLPPKPTVTPRPDPRPATVIHHKPHPATVVTKAPQSVESDKFIDLGDDFRRKQSWNAAEAAYKEAIKLSPGNADADVELGFLYVDRDKMDEAQRTYAQLRSLSPSYASDLLAEINKRRNQRVH